MENTGGFVAGTLVHADKGLVPIEKIKVGDMVLSRHESGRDALTEYKRVSRAFCSGEDTLVQIPYIREFEPDIVKIVYMTDLHPVWLELDKEWVAAGNLKVGDTLSFIGSSDEAYVLDVEGVFDYYTTDGKIFGIARGRLGKGVRGGLTILDSDGKNLYTRNSGDYEYQYTDDFLPMNISTYDPVNHEKGFGGRYKLPVYNLEVDDFHTYFIGTDGLWVHGAGHSLMK